jgi:hypothetical protein
MLEMISRWAFATYGDVHLSSYEQKRQIKTKVPSLDRTGRSPNRQNFVRVIGWIKGLEHSEGIRSARGDVVLYC